jgi:hypothetical protein
MSQFSRNTIINAIEAIQFSTHAELEKFLLRFELDEEVIETGGLQPRTVGLMKYLIKNPERKGPSGADLIFEIIELSIKKCEASSHGYYSSQSELYPNLVNSLRHDGFIIEDGNLKPMLPETIQLPDQENELEMLLRKFGFSIAIGHYEQATKAFARGDWAAANAQIRTYFESLLNAITDTLIGNKATSGTGSYQKWEQLTNTTPPFLLTALNEWEMGGKGGFLQGFWKRLHPAGSHPGLSDEEDCTLRLHLAVVVSAHLMKRLSERLPISPIDDF